MCEAAGRPVACDPRTSAVERTAGTRAELNVAIAETLASGWDRGQARPR